MLIHLQDHDGRFGYYHNDDDYSDVQFSYSYNDSSPISEEGEDRLVSRQVGSRYGGTSSRGPSQSLSLGTAQSNTAYNDFCQRRGEAEAYANHYDKSSSPGNARGHSSSAMRPSASQSSHGSVDQYYPRRSSQRNHVSAYDEQPTDFDSSSDTNYFITGDVRQSRGTYDYEPLSPFNSSSMLRIPDHNNVV